MASVVKELPRWWLVWMMLMCLQMLQLPHCFQILSSVKNGSILDKEGPDGSMVVLRFLLIVMGE